MAPSQLQQLVDHEMGTSKRKVSRNAQITLIGNHLTLRELEKVKVVINDAELQLHTFVDDKFITQIVKRIYDSDEVEKKNIIIYTNTIESDEKTTKWENTFSVDTRTLKIYFHYHITNNNHRIIELIKREICKLITIYSSSGSIYGFVSEAYTPTNQIKFREEFLQLCQRYDERLEIENSYAEIKKGRVIEYFNYMTEDSEFDIKCGLVYGKNNGYGSYYVTWVREFRETKSRLLPFKTENKYNWQNNPKILSLGEEYHLAAFTKNVAEEGKGILNVCDKIVEHAKNETIDSSIIMEVFDSILDKIACARASKQRVKEHYKNLYLVLDDKKDKNSIWAVAQSICYTGTFEKAIPFTMRDLLIKAGTELIDEGFTKFNDTYERGGIKLKMKYT